ncbi:MAG: phenylalanine--tRNA ligase subunit beta [Nitrospirota bacterium]|nr:phenylalanine--tRNA ligase subunit beta [Nitrospirota bacterium]
MIISLNWLKDYVDIQLSPEELSHRLTMAGLEIEGREDTADGDILLEVNVTPNRPDCLSVFGIAREVSAITGASLRKPEIALKEEGEAVSSLTRIEVKDYLSCPRYAARVVTGVKVGESPEWLRKRLQAIGQRSVNNVVDITNYLLFEMGHPTHAFDYDLLAEKGIVVRRGTEGELLTALDGREHEVCEDTLLICDGGNTPVALAGVIGGLDSSVTEQTTNILIESAYFHPAMVRKTAKCLGIKTDSSYRFERGVDVEGLIYSLDRVAQLVAEVAGGTVAKGRIDIYPSPLAELEIALRPERVNKILGTDISGERIAEILRNLSFCVKALNSGPDFFVTPPPFRKDVEVEIDLIEEIARIHGYQHIPVTLHEGEPSTAPVSRSQDMVKELRGLLTAQGLMEAVNFSFLNPAHLDHFMIPADDPLRRIVAIRNPLTAEQGAMRSILIPSLVENLRWNQNRGTRDVRIFEIARTFIAGSGSLPEETMHLACLLSGRQHEPHWLRKAAEMTFFDIKGIVEEMLDLLSVTNHTWRAASIPFLHPGMSASLVVDGKDAGYVGALHPDVAEAMDVQGPVFVAELDVTILAEGRTLRSYRSLPRFPAADRDMALLVDAATSAEDVLAIIRQAGGSLMEDVSLFDVYRGANIPEDKKSMAFSIRYRDPEKTLSDAEVKEMHAGILDRVNKALGAELRH